MAPIPEADIFYLEPQHGGSVSPSIQSPPNGPFFSAQKRRFQSQRLLGEYEQPWISDKRLHNTKRSNMIVRGWVFIAFALSGYIWYNAFKSVGKHDYCLILDDSFKQFDNSVWNKEVHLRDPVTHSFEWNTADSDTSYISSDGLVIYPDLTNQSSSISLDKLENGYTLNLTKLGVCTLDSADYCVVSSNASSSQIINPVRSAKLTTKGKKTIRYGRIEITAKLPRGDWLWPVIKLMPEENHYGDWPRSGEIYVSSSRGNNGLFKDGGRDTSTSALHWGPSNLTDSYWRSINGRSIRRKDFSDGFNVFGMEWSEKYLYTYINSRLVQVLFIGMGQKSFWDLGNFAAMTATNQSLFTNPWGSSGNLNSPFDRPFHLVLGVGVGGTNGWFRDGVGKKPWVDTSNNAMTDFWGAVDSWFPTWAAGADRGMTIKQVKMWQQKESGQACS